MEELKKKYAGRDVEFFAMYVREPHAGETGFKRYRNHETYEHKREYAQELVRIKHLTIPVLVDGMDQKVHTMLGNLPNYCYIVNKRGNVEYKATWLLADAVDEVLAEMVTADDPSRPLEKTMDTSHVGVAI
ncbi:MAG: hypothetical protein ACE5MM_01265 [Nitrospiraceae bacterium]